MTDKFSLSVDFGDITKTEVKWEPLEKALASVRINPDHALFREVAKSKRTSLCIVLETVACKGDSPLSEDSDMKGKPVFVECNMVNNRGSCKECQDGDGGSGGKRSGAKYSSLEKFHNILKSAAVDLT